jgi:hypothetical protein
VLADLEQTFTGIGDNPQPDRDADIEGAISLKVENVAGNELALVVQAALHNQTPGMIDHFKRDVDAHDTLSATSCKLGDESAGPAPEVANSFAV